MGDTVALTSDGRYAALASDDQTLKVYALDTGRLVAIYIRDASFRCCTFSRADVVIASSSNGAVHILQLIVPDNTASSPRGLES